MNRSSPLWKRWAPLLDVLPERSAEALGSWLPRLALAIGPLRGEPARGEGEPDGLSGLTARGSYERLVMSEWGVAEVAPEEFIRRAAMGEHLFLRRAMRVPEQTTCSQVWIDAGPEQLGSPRLAHIALLIVLAERAAAAGVRFRWGVLQEPDIHEGLEPEHLVELMGSRSVDRAAALGLTDFLTVSDTADLWWIGGPQLREAVGLPGAVVEVEDVLDPDVRALDVHVEGQTLRLSLPARDIVLSLLRNPLVTVPDLPEPSGELSVGCSPAGSVLLVRRKQQVVAYAMPKQVRVNSKRRDGINDVEGAILAVGWSRRRVMVLTLHDGQLCLQSNSTSRWTAPRTLPLPAGFIPRGQSSRLSPLLALPRSYGAGELRDGFLVLDGAEQLWALVFSHQESERVAAGVIEMQEHDHQFRLAVRHQDKLGVCELSQATVSESEASALGDLRFRRVNTSPLSPDDGRLGGDHPSASWSGVPVVGRREGGALVWHRQTRNGVVEQLLSAPPGWTVLGEDRPVLPSGPPKAWFMLSPERTTVSMAPSGPSWDLDAPVLPGAFVTTGRERRVVVWSQQRLYVLDPLFNVPSVTIDLRLA